MRACVFVRFYLLQMLMCNFRITSSNKLVLSLNLYLAFTNQEVAGVSSYCTVYKNVC